MKLENDHNYIRVHKLALIIIALVVAAGLLGWRLGHSSTSFTPQPNNTNQTTTVNNANTAAVKSLVSYTLPDGWREASCTASVGTVYVVPAGATATNCDANPSAPVKISIDQGSHTDCNQLQNIQDVKKHTCISLYINGHKSLKSSTEYLTSSSYHQDTTINSYYIDTGRGVVELDYVYTVDNSYQAGFDQLANSITVKS